MGVVSMGLQPVLEKENSEIKLGELSIVSIALLSRRRKTPKLNAELVAPVRASRMHCEMRQSPIIELVAPHVSSIRYWSVSPSSVPLGCWKIRV